MRGLVVCLIVLLSASCASAPPPAPPRATAPTAADFLANMGRVSGPELARRITIASRSPLGTKENPVRVNMPAGQQAYLRRLRCSTGSAPTFNRVGNFGPGVYGSIIDGYNVVCPTGEPKTSMIYMDMYHPENDEKAAPPGFAIVG